jgi:hypothetical protein
MIIELNIDMSDEYEDVCHQNLFKEFCGHSFYYNNEIMKYYLGKEDAITHDFHQ